ncbi:MAG: hypothetical protein ACE5H1_02960, partial [Thermodesulfobacteriota bacterium]
YVFEPGYKMPTIEETSEYMMREKRLPTMGEELKPVINLARMSMQLLETTEIQQKQITELNERIKLLERKIKN